MTKIINAFSVNMLVGPKNSVRFEKITTNAAGALCASSGIDSYIGHADTASILTQMLKIQIDARRASCVLGSGEKALLAQYSGPRLPEGATRLPEGAKIEFYLVEIL